MFSKFKSIFRCRERFESFFGFLTFAFSDSKAVCLVCTTHYAPTELVKLGKSKTLSSFNNDVGCIRDVYSYLYYRGGYKDIYFMISKLKHYGVFVFGGHFPVEDTNCIFLKYVLFQTFCFSFYTLKNERCFFCRIWFFNAWTNHIGLSA